MLTSQDFKELEKEANKLYGDLEIEIIQEIAERIANVGYANTVVLNDIEIAQEMGILYQDVINLVAEYNDASVSQIQTIFETAGAKSLKSDDKIYKAAGLNPKGLSTSMLQLLEATANKTHNNLSNLTMTTAKTSQNQFYEAMNKAYLEVSTGVKSYSQSIIDTIKDVSSQGAYVEYPSGQHRSLESAVRTNILTSVNQTSGKLQLLRADEMNWDLMELSAHGGARPEHAEWQGKIVSRSGRKGYLSLNDIGYGEVTGFQGVNCRHTWFPYFEGSTLTYTDRELRELKNETVFYNGQKISKYDASQIQRKMERQIRQDKKDIAGLQGILTSNTKDSKLIEETNLSLANTKIKLSQHNSILNDFIDQTGFKKDNSRLFVGNLKVNSIKKDKIKSETVKNLEKVKIQHNPVQKLKKELSVDEIIEKISGGDETKGSCSSVALAYIGNRNGLDVLDFRGGESQNFFSTPQNILKMCDDLKIDYKMELNYNDILGALNLLNKVEEGKEYYLTTGAHAAIVRRNNEMLQYLELQNKDNNGFKQFTIQTLKKRFGCKQSHVHYGMKCKARSLLIEVDEFKNNDMFEEILGFINTSTNKQMKGVNGNAK